MSYAEAFREEESNKDIIYKFLDEEFTKAEKKLNEEIAYQQSGKYDDLDGSMVAQGVTIARENFDNAEEQRNLIVKYPYFGHIRLKNENELSEYFLSDSTDLDTAIAINTPDDREMIIVPFKQDSERPMLSALFNIYARKSGEETTVVEQDRKVLYQTQVIRNVEISQRILHNITTLFSIDGDDTIDSDDFLAQRLEENRSDANLRNIISTLQKQQFEIISTDLNDSFVVQGCAGSGKTQCLLHRMFYLRANLADKGWDKVLLITPTKLFRNYSADLIRRFKLGDVANTSLAFLYKQLLEIYDKNFSERQYKFILSEEYLPDSYLHQVYDLEMIAKIDEEIDNAIDRYIREGCELTDTPLPERNNYTIEFANQLVAKLKKKITDFDELASKLKDDQTYLKHRSELDSTEKKLSQRERRMDTLVKTKHKLLSDKEHLHNLLEDYKNFSSKLDNATLAKVEEYKRLQVNLTGCIKKIDECNDEMLLSQLLIHYAGLRGRLQTYFQTGSLQDNHYQVSVIAEMISKYQSDIESLTENLTVDKWQQKIDKKIDDTENNIKLLQEEIDFDNLLIDELKQWFIDNDLEEAQNQRKIFRNRLTNANFYLSGLEARVFEQEVWNALAPLKQECDIETLEIEKLENGKEKRTRILYKSDLLFYLRIYRKLHKNEVLPQYTLICIDEGQDMHSIDYDMIRSLYPEAALNIFGDTQQVLHEACGITNWKQETKIERIFELKNNYRTRPGIVEFCNEQFGSSMVPVGRSVGERVARRFYQNQPWKEEITDNTVVIVKNHKCFERMCSNIYDEALLSKLEFIDTNADEVKTDIIPCYSIFAAKGLEFTSVLVYSEEMTNNQKVVACTRAMEHLVYVG